MKLSQVGAAVAQPDWGIRVAYPRDPAGNLIEIHEELRGERA